MDTFIEYYFGMAFPYLHFFQILFLIILFLYFKLKNKIDKKQYIQMIGGIQLILITALILFFIIDIYLYYDQTSSVRYEILPHAPEKMKLYFERSNERTYPFLVSQLVVYILDYIFYVLLYIKKRTLILKL